MLSRRCTALRCAEPRCARPALPLSQWRASCNKCGKPKPESAGLPARTNVAAKPGDWICGDAVRGPGRCGVVWWVGVGVYRWVGRGREGGGGARFSGICVAAG